MLRRAVILAALATLSFPAAAAAQGSLLMPGVNYSREVEFTSHGPVVIHVITAPKPGGLYGLKPVLSNGTLVGREKVTAMQKDVTPFATVAGVNGDLFNWDDGHPSGVLLQDGILKSPPLADRSSIGIDDAGTLHVDRIAFFGTWKGTGQRRPLNEFNHLPGPNGISLYTTAWGPATPKTAGTVEAVLYPFPATVPNTDLSGQVIQIGSGSGTPIPAGGAVLVARGLAAGKLAAEAPVGTTVATRLIFKPDWAGIVDAIGGGPVIVRDGKPVFRSFEAFGPEQLLPRNPRTAVGQLPTGRIILVAVDGRQPGYSVGMTNFELAQALVRLGAVAGSAMDAGGSTTMAFNGKLLNRPSDPGGERSVAEALLVFYYGVYAPLPTAPVLSPNGDSVGERQSLSYRLVRPSTVNGSLLGPDGVPRVTQTGLKNPGLYRVSFSGLTEAGTPETEGLWHWTISATDDQGRSSTADRTFWLNNTLGFLRVRPSRLALRPRGSSLLASFTLTRPARVVARVETPSGVTLRTIARTSFQAGDVTLIWNGRVGAGSLAYSGRYVMHVSASNEFGTSHLRQRFSVHRVHVKPKKHKDAR